MEEIVTYVVLSPVLHNGRPYDRGAAIVLAYEHAEPLLHRGVIKTPENVIAAALQPSPVVLGASTLDKLNRGELSAYALAHGVVVDDASTKDQLLAAIAAKFEAASSHAPLRSAVDDVVAETVTT